MSIQIFIARYSVYYIYSQMYIFGTYRWVKRERIKTHDRENTFPQSNESRMIVTVKEEKRKDWENGKEWGKHFIENKVCRGLFTDSHPNWGLPHGVVMIARFQWFPSSILIFLFIPLFFLLLFFHLLSFLFTHMILSLVFSTLFPPPPLFLSAPTPPVKTQ